MTELVIRPVRRDDYDAWLPLWEGYNAFYGRSGPTALDVEITRNTWERFFSSSEPVYALVATHETNHVAQRVYDKVAERSGFIVYRHLL